MKKGSLVRFKGHSRVIPTGKLLFVHDVRNDNVVVWVVGASGKWSKKTVSMSDLELVVD